jgi:hypothetical protein
MYGVSFLELFFHGPALICTMTVFSTQQFLLVLSYKMFYICYSHIMLVLHSMCEFFIEPPPDTQWKERQGGEREI